MGIKNAAEATIGTCDVYIDDIFVGYTGEEVSLTIARDIVELLSGLPQVRVTGVVTKEEVSATFEFMQINAINFSYAIGKDGVVDELTVPGNTIIEMGGDTSLGLQHKLDLVHKFPDDRELRIVFWKSRPTPNFDMSFALKYLGIKSKWIAEEDSTRAAGKRLVRIQIEDLNKS